MMFYSDRDVLGDSYRCPSMPLNIFCFHTSSLTVWVTISVLVFWVPLQASIIQRLKSKTSIFILCNRPPNSKSFSISPMISLWPVSPFSVLHYRSHCEPPERSIFSFSTQLATSLVPRLSDTSLDKLRARTRPLSSLILHKRFP